MFLIYVVVIIPLARLAYKFYDRRLTHIERMSENGNQTIKEIIKSKNESVVKLLKLKVKKGKK